MGARLIFFKHPKTKEENMKFCPIVQLGCDKCFFNYKCKGDEKEKATAFRLTFPRETNVSGFRTKLRRIC